MADFAMKINLMADSSATRVPVMPGGSMVCRLNQRGCQNMKPKNYFHADLTHAVVTNFSKWQISQ